MGIAYNIDTNNRFGELRYLNNIQKMSYSIILYIYIIICYNI